MGQFIRDWTYRELALHMERGAKLAFRKKIAVQASQTERKDVDK
jgi:hypothetical protein